VSILQRAARASAFKLDAAVLARPGVPAAHEAPPGAAKAREALAALRERVRRESDRLVAGWRDAIAREDFLPSARNLADYLALRRQDLSALQADLSALGLSALGRCEPHVRANLDAVAAALARLCGDEPEPFPDPELWSEGARRLREQRRVLFGHATGAAIMATLPTEAASDPLLVDSYVAAGMDCARIDCGRDSPPVWRAMVGQVRRAAERHGRSCRILMDLPGPKCRIESLSPERPERVQVGDRLRLAQRVTVATPSNLPVVAVSLPQVVAGLAVGAPVSIDDGKIRGRVVAIEGPDRIVEIVGARRKGGKLKAGKGVAFPGAPLDLPPLSHDDLAALPVVAECADLIGFSFVQRPRDIVALDRALAAARPGGPPIPLVLKIETLEAVRNLPRLIVQAAGSRPVAAMIARGGLAAELGHARLAEIQEEILRLCEAARIPVVSTNHTLDDLVKDGPPSRAEAADAAMTQRAACAMLNQGPHVVEAIGFLAEVIGKTSRRQAKRTARLPPLHSWPLETLGLAAAPLPEADGAPVTIEVPIR
jgi:pyruvate kinase